MFTMYRILGKKGRITIPYEIRQRIGFRYNDILSFTQQDDGSVLIRREKICDNCKELAEDFDENFTLEDFLDSLSEEEQRNALVHLSLLWADRKYKVECTKELFVKCIDIVDCLFSLLYNYTYIKSEL